MHAYLALLRDVKENGVSKDDRTKVGTRSVFARQLRFDLSKGFPLVTTKKIHMKSVIHELLWFLSGSTNINDLDATIWDEWATKSGALGPIYGKQWTAWPTKDGGEINQIDNIIYYLKNNPDSRRILFHGWNVEYLPDESISPQENVFRNKMALPPCHLLYQFYVVNNKLSCQLYIRSSDIFLGLSFNIGSAALLVHMLAQQCDMDVGELIINTGDTHIYNNHIKQVDLQLSREPRSLPTLKINRKPDSIYDYRYEDFELIGYDPHPAIKAPVAV